MRWRWLWLVWALVCGWIWCWHDARAAVFAPALEPEAGRELALADVWQERALRAERRARGRV